MENYINEILSVCGLPFNEVSNDYKLIVLGGKCLYLSNYNRIIDYSVSKIVLKVKKDIIEIDGESMQISQINKNEIMVAGKIINIKVGDHAEKK